MFPDLSSSRCCVPNRSTSRPSATGRRRSGGGARKKGVLRAIFNDTDDALGAIAGGFVVLSREFVKEHPEASKIFVEQSARARHGRLDVLLRWLDETKPDLVVLEDLRTPDAKFSARCMSSATDWNCSPQRSLFRHEPADRKR